MKLFKGFIGLLGLMAMVSCESDFDINAPYDAQPVVYGFLEYDVDTQYVKVNKTFVGDGNNVSYAMINDSTQFKSVSGTVSKLKNGAVEESYPLQSTYVDVVEEGIFYSDSQKVFYWVPTSEITEDATYELNIDINEGEETVTGSTQLVGEVSFDQTFRNRVTNGNGVQFSNTATPGNSVYSDLTVEWKAAENGKRYQAILVFNYEEHTATDTVVKSMTSNIGTVVGATGQIDYSLTYSGKSFYIMIDNRLKDTPNESEILRRKAIGVEFHIVVADEDFHTYIEVNEPSTGVINQKPVYTNLEGSYGLFASRRTTVLDVRNTITNDPLKLTLTSEKELVFGDYTSAYKFCTKYYTDPLVVCP